MVWFVAYLGIGLIAYIVAAIISHRRHGKSGVFIILAVDPFMWIFLPFWPIAILFAWSDSKIPVSPDHGYTIPSPEITPLEGKQGIAVTPLRPAGRVRIEDSLYDALAEGGMVEKNSEVTVIGQNGMSIKVVAFNPENAAEQPATRPQSKSKWKL